MANLVRDLPDGRALEIERAADPRHDGQLRELGDAPGRPPAEQVEERLGADDQEQLLARDAQGFERVDGVRGPRAAKFHVGDGEFRMAGDRELDHRVPVRRGGQVGVRLVGRPRGGHEQHAVQTEQLRHVVGEQQVSIVDRIERAAEDGRARHDQRRVDSIGRRT